MERFWPLHRWLAWPAWFLLLSALAGCPAPLGDTDAALALEDIAAGFGESRLKARTLEPVRRTIDYRVDARRYRGDLYLPRQAAKAGIVLVPGVVADGKDDPRLVALAYTLARVRFAVLVPDLLGLRRYRVRASNVDEVADAFRYLASRREVVPQGRVGVAGFSYGAGPVLLAAIQPDIRPLVRFVAIIGGYHDLRAIVTYFTTGYYETESDGEWAFRKPNPYAKWVFVLSNADLLERAADQRALQAMAERISNDPKADITGLSQRLEPDARALYELLVNEDPARVPALIDGLPVRIRQELEGINPAAQDLSALQAEAILLHGRSDNMIPYTQSIALSHALPSEQVRLFLIEGLAHVDIEVGREDIPQLLAAMEALLAHRREN